MGNRIPENFSISDLKGKNFASVSEVAAIMRIDAQTVRAEIARGNIPAVKAGAYFRVPTAWLFQQAAAS